MITPTATCPRCNHLLKQRHDSSARGTNEYTDPWVFIDHNAPDQRGDSVILSKCSGSGRNIALARDSL